MNIKYYSKILSYLIVFVLILLFLVGLDIIKSIIISIIIITVICIIENIITINDNYTDNNNNCNSCVIDKKIIDNYQNITPNGSVFTNSNILTNVNNLDTNNSIPANNLDTNNTVAGNNSFGRAPANIPDSPVNINNNNFGRVPSNIENNTNNNADNNTDNNFNNFMDNQSKENEKIITNYLTSNADEFYMNNYINYQKNGHELSDIETSLRENIWRASIGNQNVVQPFLRDAKKYYQDIFTRGVNNSPPDEMLKNYMEAAEYNYITPLNEGMVNPEYTFVSPSNWNFLNFSPPVCVIDKKRKNTVIPTITRDDHMPFASMDEFDRASRFTGNMQINTDYIHNVLNNPMV